jgi:Uma2 family endonuclease
LYPVAVGLETAFESTRFFTQEEFVRFAEAHSRENRRLELLNGRIVMNPLGGWPQGEGGLLVAAQLLAFVRQRQLGRVFGADQGFELPSGDTVAPDAAYVSSERWAASGPHQPGRFLRVVPELVVEVMSPTTASFDRGEKRAIYERNGVAEYWLLDMFTRRLSRLSLAEGRFGAPVDFDEGDVFEPLLLVGLRFPVVAVLA